MRRKRHHETKVWHDPHLTAAGRRRQQGARAAVAEETGETAPGDPRRRRRRGRPHAAEAKRVGVRIVARTDEAADPREAERTRLLGRLLAVEGRPAISQAARAFREAGFDFPRNQYVWLQLLEHNDEQTVGEAIERLREILLEEAPARRAVLDSRLRRIEEFADDETTRAAAADLRRIIKERWAEHPSSSSSPA